METTTDMKNEISKAQSQETFAQRSVRKNSLRNLNNPLGISIYNDSIASATLTLTQQAVINF